MTAIAKTHQSLLESTRPDRQALALHFAQWHSLCSQVQATLALKNTHPARCVVLLPFYQLQAVAQQAAKAKWQTGFIPHWETTQSWSQRVAEFTPGTTDLRFDSALDSLQAAAWLAQAGLANQQSLLVPTLVSAAQQLGAVVAAVAPAKRDDWAITARAAIAQGLQEQALSYEAAVSRIALEWALASRYASDVLFAPELLAQMDCLIVLEGLQANPLSSALAAHWSAISSTLAFEEQSPCALVQLHAASDAHDEADRAAACVLQHIQAGRSPVALAAVDRVLTRRISATLALQGITLADETGWKLSTTRAGAALMALLRAAQWGAGPDAVLDWLKHTSAPPADVSRLEQTFRGINKPVTHINTAQQAINFIASDGSMRAADGVLQGLRRPRVINAWLQSLADALHTCGMWSHLQSDQAGADCLEVLLLHQTSGLEQHSISIDLAEFSTWVQAVLESASFKPGHVTTGQAQVTVLPLAQVLARPFAALVLPGADEQRLPRSPEPPGNWSPAQRQALGLPSRSALAAEQTKVWQNALAFAQVDVVWRTADGEQAVQPSALVQGLLYGAGGVKGLGAAIAPEPRVRQTIAAQASAMPAPQASAHFKISRLSASAYKDLRTCPYRYFALQLLGLREAPELDVDVDKSDFGTWLHAVLADFHLRRKSVHVPTQVIDGADVDATAIAKAQGQATDATQTTHQTLHQTDSALLDQCAASQPSPGSGFTPFAASWPQVRDSYLAWLHPHEATGWQFDVGELALARSHAGIQLVGRLDRVDRLNRGPTAGVAMVLDYKTESYQTSKERVRDPLEDTQLAFYAALLNEDDTEAAYINIAERNTEATPQGEVTAALEALLAGISQDVQRIHAGAAMPALGEGKACDYCAARGLCRKDFWTP